MRWLSSSHYPALILWLLFLAFIFAGLAGCTTVSATLQDGTLVHVTTFAQNRQDIDIGRDADGGVHWRASNSSVDQTLAKSIADLAGVIAAAPKPMP